jgi:DNA-binding XRE family transcriptional regulator
VVRIAAARDSESERAAVLGANAEPLTGASQDAFGAELASESGAISEVHAGILQFRRYVNYTQIVPLLSSLGIILGVIAYDPSVVRLTRLRELRLRKALNQQELADKAGLTRATLSRLEAGLQEPYPSTTRKIARALGVEPEELMEPRQEA